MSYDYERPEDYPDWDGDESIMYYIDHYTEDDEEDEDDSIWIICEACGNEILVDENAGSFTCPECGTTQNI